MSLSTNSLTDNSVVCLMAPTASGKTALAYELYDTGRYELISVDSALIYRDMNIGTAKPTATELERYPHHLVDIIDPTQSYSVAEFVCDVSPLIDSCHQNGKIPLLVGGTMMYYMALLDGLSPVPDSNDKVRLQVEEWRLSEGISALYDYLGKVDPIGHQRLKPTDLQRITRALEVYIQTDKALSTWQREPKQALAHNPAQRWHALAVMPDRPWLHERIAQRLDIMWNEGLVTEVLDLLTRYPLTPNMPAMRCVGYRQVLEYLVHIQHPIFEMSHLDKESFYTVFAQSSDTNTYQTSQNNMSQKAVSTFKPNSKTNTEHQTLSCHQMQNKALYATRQLAKRQYTWLRKLTQLSSDRSDSSIELPSHTNNKTTLQSFTTMAQARDSLG
ncbi:tRNA (adenosine(37)-N6)-dimethylallyltransferase MiaA [Psychrobacter frigidicola]|uniref:tRNA dimethylallyltransferase n=1 Tax=Psychrobacter frigidicola TaxID=45611 RepID=A0A5C7A337_9GAMM|nr:tRNA (adenosine(37)-N6)-dimethylallyltransferase MiaA [Psychrobacter frigidicola]TXD98017.1 tRNA (adenosine(37)-N6)-dimethylallyltransferase MiaA [Psychrobacter frigidicola]